MSSDINISVGYDPINESNIFTSGDYISGKVTLELAKECKVDSFIVKLKGKAEVKWTENYGRTVVVYHRKEKFFSISQDLIQSKQGNNIIGRGYNAFPFNFQIPPQDLPSSYKGTHGKIRYTLEANLSRSMRMDSKAKAEFTIINGNLRNDPFVKAPQNLTIDKKMKVFSSGMVGMDVNIPRTGFYQGEGIQVVASIQNKSSRDIKPKYCLYKKCSYFTKTKRKVETKDILKEVGDPIPPSAGQTVTRTITIPSDTSVTILNCEILKVEYRLRVYLDVKYALDPLVKFPIIILPALPEHEAGQHPDQPAYGYGAFANSDMQGGSSYLYPPLTVVTPAVMQSDINISVGYDPINENNVFTSGDYISGKVTLELAKECKVESLIIKLKGKAEVRWSEGETHYYQKDKFFSISQDLIKSKQGNNVIGQGYNAFPFNFQIPPQDLPSSYKGTYGKIRYTLEANLSRSMRMDSKAKAEFTIINGNLRNDPFVKAPQNQAIDKKLKLFSSSTVGMDVNIPRTGFYQGEGVQVVASIQNKSSRDIKPKYLLYRKCSYFAEGNRKVETEDILKEVGDPIPPSAGQTVTRTITIPSDTSVTILNCEILKVEYRLRVSLDVKYASDPLVKFPIIILPALLEYEAGQQPDQPAYGYGAFANSDMQGGSSYLYPPLTGPSAPLPTYGTYDIYPFPSAFDGKS